MEYSKNTPDHWRPGLRVAKMDWMTKLVSADGGDAGVAIVECAAAEAYRSGHLASTPMFWETALVSPEKPARRSPAGKRLVTQPV